MSLGHLNLCSHILARALFRFSENRVKLELRLNVSIDLEIVFRSVLVDIGLSVVVCLVDLVLHGVTGSSDAS